MYDPSGQHPNFALLLPLDAHPPPQNVPLNAFAPENTIQTQRRVIPIPTDMINKKETITYIKIMKKNDLKKKS
tara:strand:- start:16 stop:234 length:219 start_codon:yes stop_codon:yes gene_type:complete